MSIRQVTVDHEPFPEILGTLFTGKCEPKQKRELFTLSCDFSIATISVFLVKNVFADSLRKL